MSKIKVDDEVLALAAWYLDGEGTPEEIAALGYAIQVRIYDWLEEDAHSKHQREMASKSMWRDEDDERDLRIMRWEN